MTNSLLQDLGFDKEDRVVLFHFDDLGMCQSTIPAWENLMDFGLVRSASVMVPCPWFPEVAKKCREQSDLDIGVHLTFTCEWKSYRWGALTTGDPASGMLDKDGYFYDDEVDFWQNADRNAAEKEVYAQIERSLNAGIDVTHLDSHMFSMLSSKMLPIFHEAAKRYKVPLLSFNSDYLKRRPGYASYLNLEINGHNGYEGYTPLIEEYGDIREYYAKMEQENFPLFDQWASLSYTDPSDRVGNVKKILNNLEPGLTFFMLHPALDTPELRAICPGADWQIRVADYEAFMSKDLKQFIHQKGIQSITFKEIADVMKKRGLK